MTTPDDIRRELKRQAGDIVSIIAHKESEIRKMGFASFFLEAIESSILALLSDAERNGAWAVVRRVKNAKFMVVGAKTDMERVVQDNAVYQTKKELLLAARQVASSFGPDPEGEKKES